MARTDVAEEKIRQLLAQGDTLLGQDQWTLALDPYRQALGLMPEPVKAHRLAAQTHASLGDAYLLLKQHAVARLAFQDALESAGGSENAYVRLRLGQCAYELGELGTAREHLAWAHALKGERIFEGEEEKYLRLATSLDSSRKA